MSNPYRKMDALDLVQQIILGSAVDAAALLRQVIEDASSRAWDAAIAQTEEEYETRYEELRKQADFWQQKYYKLLMSKQIMAVSPLLLDDAHEMANAINCKGYGTCHGEEDKPYDFSDERIHHCKKCGMQYYVPRATCLLDDGHPALCGGCGSSAWWGKYHFRTEIYRSL